MIDGKDFWMNPAEVNKRLTARNNIAKKKTKKEK